MNYQDLTEALESEDEALMKEYLISNVITPCLHGHPSTDIHFNIDDVIVTNDEFVKPNLLSVSQFLVTPLEHGSYEVHVEADYMDTLSGATDGDFVKTMVIVVAQGYVTPKVEVLDATVHTYPEEVV